MYASFAGVFIFSPVQGAADMSNKSSTVGEMISLPILRDEASVPPRKDELHTVYGEICNSWRMLTDVRFKLSGFVPTVFGIFLVNIL